ncbi:hypothetical protein BKA23_2706 [Rudaeicoccus suwonensis]|uniref:Uncharacterized protein n=1 Tax=Rudaeicoccus suwonensis TaxID=657409 RepID=A0A561E413_9MICO|nr:hypothetical protein BKA23_2706 [Rudaeicoccus suwonensis]
MPTILASALTREPFNECGTVTATLSKWCVDGTSVHGQWPYVQPTLVGSTHPPPYGYVSSVVGVIDWRILAHRPVNHRSAGRETAD